MYQKQKMQQIQKSKIEQISNQQNILTLNFPLGDDYQLLHRDAQISIKYKFTLHDKQIKLLDPHKPITSIKNLPIVCSYADMQFKLSPTIHKQFIRLISNKLILGYELPQKSIIQLILNRIKQKVYAYLDDKRILCFSTMLGIYWATVRELTGLNQTVLVFTPCYYRFLYTLNDTKRNILQYQLKVRHTSQGKQYYIDFQQLKSLFENNNIKLVVWVNPHNPSGRIWRKDQVQQLSNLIVKHKCFIFSDDIFLQCVKESCCYTSLMEFHSIHPYIIWGSSFGKAFNCSGNSLSYAVIPNAQTYKKLAHSFDHIPLFADYTAFKLLQSCYTVGEQWRLKTIQYIRQNYQFLIDQADKRQLGLDFFTLDCGYLAVVDFGRHKWSYTQIKQRIQSQNIFPTYFDASYHNIETQSISTIRVNLAMNRSLIFQLVNRLQKAIMF